VREDRIFDVISLDLLGGFELVVILHYAIVLETRPPVGIWSTDGFAMVDPDVRQCPVTDHYPLSTTVQRKSLIKIDVDDAG
jgi:hypothetical protein